MRHYVAVQDESGRWYYANEGVSRLTGEEGWTPTGACRPWRVCGTCDPHGFRGPAVSSEGCETCGGTGRVDKESPCGGHDTAEEAYEHERQRLLAESVRFCGGGTEHDAKARTLHKCQVDGCDTHTSGFATVGAYRHWHICPEHQTTEHLGPLLHVGESWES